MQTQQSQAHNYLSTMVRVLFFIFIFYGDRGSLDSIWIASLAKEDGWGGGGGGGRGEGRGSICAFCPRRSGNNRLYYSLGQQRWLNPVIINWRNSRFYRSAYILYFPYDSLPLFFFSLFSFFLLFQQQKLHQNSIILFPIFIDVMDEKKRKPVESRWLCHLD